jgi:hypothetical protein
MTKKCSDCNITKNLNEFGNSSRHKGGKHVWCKECANRRCRESYQKHIEKRRERNRVTRKRTPEYFKRKRNTRMFLLYGMTEQDYDEMLISQGGVCKICKGTPTKVGNKHTSSKIRFSIDHNHKTGEVRGLICGVCNVMLGHAKDSIEVLISAIEYLKAEPTKFKCGRKKKYNKDKKSNGL